MSSPPFHFKKFSVWQDGAAHAVGTDGVLLGAWADTAGAGNILDIGTGTGLIALMMAQRSAPEVEVQAVDLHGPSVACAARNFHQSPWASRIRVQEIAFQLFSVNCGHTFDLIVSNPPFFSELTVSPDAARSLGRFSGTLSPGDLLEGVGRLLAPNGRFCTILPAKEGVRLREMGVLMGLYCTREVEVFSRAGKPVERVLLQLERDPGRFCRERIEIYDASGQYTEPYRSLVDGFYL